MSRQSTLAQDADMLDLSDAVRCALSGRETTWLTDGSGRIVAVIAPAGRLDQPHPLTQPSNGKCGLCGRDDYDGIHLTEQEP